MSQYDPDDMDFVRSAIWNAIASGLDIHDLAAMAEHAETVHDLDNATNILGLAERSTEDE